MNIQNKRDLSIVVAALDLYRDYLENDDHAPTLDQLPYTIADIKNLYQTFNSILILEEKE